MRKKENKYVTLVMHYYHCSAMIRTSENSKSKYYFQKQLEITKEKIKAYTS